MTRRPLRREALRQALLARGLGPGELCGVLHLWRQRYQALPPGEERARCRREGTYLRGLADALDGEPVPSGLAELGIEVLGALSLALRAPEEAGRAVREHTPEGVNVLLFRRADEALHVEDAATGRLVWRGPPGWTLSRRGFTGLPSIRDEAEEVAA